MLFSTEWIELLFWSVWVTDLHQDIDFCQSELCAVRLTKPQHTKTLIIIVSALTRPCRLYTVQFYYISKQVQWVRLNVKCVGQHIPSTLHIWSPPSGSNLTASYLLDIISYQYVTPPLPLIFTVMRKLNRDHPACSHVQLTTILSMSSSISGSAPSNVIWKYHVGPDVLRVTNANSSNLYIWTEKNNTLK